jgi:acyl carrier protein
MNAKRDEAMKAVARRGDVVARVRTVLIDRLGIRREPDEIDPDAPLFGTGLGLDSVDAVELVVSLETEFSLQFPAGYMHRRLLRTVGTVADAVMAIQDGCEGSDAR